ncbi:programmed cell death protein 4 [Macrosteles quadrilineatus]|uniref:programmed cell death protein 4 n=1 Tax=Macrosteles quadrilineatus TaxID=74068 RepID=UPI0023E2E3A3|nr:programmed cell death protein 4 [Macrosteles quadrilineatus]
MDKDSSESADILVDQENDIENGAVGGNSEVSKSVDNLSTDHRVKKKAKRGLLRQISKESLSNSHSVVVTQRSWKNTRRPRNGRGRGLPKKGGAGGKGVWGKPGSELVEEDVDMNDPNYESDSLDNGDVELKTIIPEASADEIRKSTESIVLEYYEHGDTDEAAAAFEDLNITKDSFLIIQFAIEIAFDHKPSHREMTSVLISDFYGRIVKQRDIALAFDTLLRNLPDLMLDTPDAPTVLGNFLARAVADDCLPPKIIQQFKEKIEEEHAQAALHRSETLLSMKHGLVRLDNVWGVGGGLRPVKYLVRQMNLLLQEYLSSGDMHEATRCLVELEVPHFHHELVYEAVVMTLEALSSSVEEAMCRLLKSLSAAVIITPDMMERGFQRVYEDMPDIILDVPLAGTVLERFVEQCHIAGFISEDMVKKMPTRGRKRFVSEGDGGRIKDNKATI